MRKQLKMAAFVAVLAVGFTANAQISTDQTTNANDISKKANATLGKADGSVKVIDNKGTIKYLQSNNGITTFTNFAPDGGEVTTWQLGGTLTTATTITTNGQSFTIDGQEFFLSDLAAADPATAATTVGGTGWTVVVRDNSGQLQQVALTDVLKVEAIRVEHPQTTNATADVNITVADLPAITGSTDPKSFKLFVFRNGAKLRIGTDFNATTAGQITILNAEVPMYNGDIVEIQYIK